MKEITEDWVNRADHIRRISAYEFAGHKLQQKGSLPQLIDQPFLDEVDEWRKGADSAAHQISEAHRDAFYKNSVCLQKGPDPNQFVGWMPERLGMLTRTLKELQSLPEQLRPYSGGQ
jgi:hypothetical protein